MAKGNKASLSAPAAGPAGRGRGQLQGGAPSLPPGHGGRGLGEASSTPTNPGRPPMPRSHPERTHIVPAMNGSSLVCDREGNILYSIPKPTGQHTAVDDGFRLPAGQAKAAKREAARKATEAANPEFFAKGGTHALWALVKNRGHPTSRQVPPPPCLKRPWRPRRLGSGTPRQAQEAGQRHPDGRHPSCQNQQGHATAPAPHGGRLRRGRQEPRGEEGRGPEVPRAGA